MGDRRKLAGLWILIVVAMVGFAFLDLLGWVRLSPKPFLHLNYAIGGILFGTGTVLAGGCISGCLYKAATGNLNSIAAQLTIPVGVMLVEQRGSNLRRGSRMLTSILIRCDGNYRCR
jgi:uncharacterized membrane protein YedE/YeeE